jgi:hypothetical protein
VKEQQQYEKLQLITVIMESFRESSENKSDDWLVKRFDALYDMNIDALIYLAQLRKINLKETSSILMK